MMSTDLEGSAVYKQVWQSSINLNPNIVRCILLFRSPTGFNSSNPRRFKLSIITACR